jgi:hypothetical protein
VAAKERGKRDKRSVRRALSDQTSYLIALVVVVAGLGLLYIAGRASLWTHRSGAQAFVNQLGSLLIVAVGLAVLWDWRGKRALAEEVLEKAQLAADLTNAGIKRVTNQYIREVDWQEYFRTVSKLDIFFAYGRTWRRTHYDQLQAVAARPEGRIRVILPDPSDAGTVERLAHRFSMTDADLVSAIKEARDDFVGLKQAGGASVSVMYRSGDPTFSCYRFDHLAILTLYSHSRKRVLIPTFVCVDGGTLYDFLRKELDELIGQARPANEDGQKGASG